MVHYKSEGIFEAPLAKVWKLLQEEHTPEKITAIHTNFQKVKVLEEKGNTMKQEITAIGMDGKAMTFQARLTFNQPKNFDIEWLTGPMAGSKVSNVYTEQGSQTKVVTSGDVKIAGMDEPSVLKIFEEMMSNSFNADQSYLKKMR